MAMSINRWLTSPPSAHPLVSPLARPSEQINGQRIASLMGDPVTALYIAPSCMMNTDAYGLARMVAAISAEYGDRTNHSTKSMVQVDDYFDYSTYGVPQVDTIHCINEDTKVLFMDGATAAKAYQFGTAVIFFYVKRGPCIDNASEQNLRAIAHGVRKERFHHLVILSDAPSTLEERRRAKALFGPLEMTYGEITYDDHPPIPNALVVY